MAWMDTKQTTQDRGQKSKLQLKRSGSEKRKDENRFGERYRERKEKAEKKVDEILSVIEDKQLSIF